MKIHSEVNLITNSSSELFVCLTAPQDGLETFWAEALQDVKKVLSPEEFEKIRPTLERDYVNGKWRWNDMLNAYGSRNVDEDSKETAILIYTGKVFVEILENY